MTAPISQLQRLCKLFFHILTNYGDGNEPIEEVSFLHFGQTILIDRSLPFAIEFLRLDIEGA